MKHIIPVYNHSNSTLYTNLIDSERSAHEYGVLVEAVDAVHALLGDHTSVYNLVQYRV